MRSVRHCTTVVASRDSGAAIRLWLLSPWGEEGARREAVGR